MTDSQVRAIKTGDVVHNQNCAPFTATHDAKVEGNIGYVFCKSASGVMAVKLTLKQVGWHLPGLCGAENRLLEGMVSYMEKQR